VTATAVGFRRTARSGVRVDNATTVDLTLEAVPLNAITVTATLREQELKDVPFSIAAPTAAQLRERGAENIEDIAATQAGFSVQNLGPGQSQVAMRGTSSGQTARDQPGVKEEVGVYLDGVPISLSLFTPDVDLFDVARVEVLRGPQGTLFGAGSLAGTVRYISNQPELGVSSVFGQVGGASIDGGCGAAHPRREAESQHERPHGSSRLGAHGTLCAVQRLAESRLSRGECRRMESARRVQHPGESLYDITTQGDARTAPALHADRRAVHRQIRSR
jgi:outer membrane cobalamin receptor